MRLGLFQGYSGPKFSLDMDMVLAAENLGFDSVWTSEAYGSDAVTPAAWILARTTRITVGTGIMQISARSPSMTAMTALTMAAISDELGVTHMTVYRWQKGMRKAENSRSVLHMLDTLMKRRKVPKRRRVGVQ